MMSRLRSKRAGSRKTAAEAAPTAPATARAERDPIFAAATSRLYSRLYAAHASRNSAGWRSRPDDQGRGIRRSSAISRRVSSEASAGAEQVLLEPQSAEAVEPALGIP